MAENNVDLTGESEKNSTGDLAEQLAKLQSNITELEQELTAYEEREAVLKDSEHAFRTLLENTNDTIMRFDRQGRHLYANQVVTKYAGIPAKDFIGKTHAELGFPEPLVNKWEKAIGRVFKTGREHRIEFELPGGEWIDWLLIPEVNKKGEVNTVLTSAREITDRKRVEVELQRERYLLETFLDHVPDHIYFKDRHGRFIRVNKAQARWFGKKDPGEFIGKTDFDFFSKEHAEKALKDENRVMQTGRSISKEEREVWPDGRVTWVSTTKMPLIDAEGDIIGTFGVSRNITERIQAEQALADSERRYRRLTENAQDIIWRTTIDGEILFINSAVEPLLGYKVNEAWGLQGGDYLSQSSKRRLETWIQKAVKDQTVANFHDELKYRHKDGRLVDFEAKVVAVRNEEGMILALEGVSRNIGDRKRAEQALQESEKRYRNLVESINDIIYRTDLNGRFTYANPVARRIIGYPMDEMKKMVYTELVRDDFKNEVENFYVRQFTEQTLTTYYEFPAIKKNGEEIWIGQNVQLSIQNDRVVGFLAVARDITERRRAEEALWRAHDQLERRVEERTSELSRSNKLLLQEINERRRAQTELQASLDNYHKAMEGIISAMALTVEMRDPYTAGHQQRVTQLAQAIAKKMGLEKNTIDGIRMAGIIHDLGKISIPAEILSKPGKLSEIVYDMIKIHPTVGFEILKSIDFPWPVAKIILQHHERLDGTGYPNGIKGDKILLESRILAVADVFEAVSSHRPYRPALGIETAKEEIVKHKGEHFDSDVVAAFEKVITGGFKFDVESKESEVFKSGPEF